MSATAQIQSPPGTNTAPSNTWYAYKTSTGDFGLAMIGHLPADSVQAIEVGTADTLGELASQGATDIARALEQLGITTSLWTQLVGQLDSGAVEHNPSFVQVGPNGPSASKGASTKIGSSAIPSNIIPTPSLGLPTGDILGILGNLQTWKGLGLVLAGAAILIFAAVEILKL